MINRLNKARHLMSEYELDAVILNPGPSQFYFSGLHLHLMERPMCLFLDPVKPPAIVLPELEKQQLSHTSLEMEAFFYGSNPTEWQQAYQKAADYIGLNGKTAGIEPTHFRYLEMNYIQPNILVFKQEPLLSPQIWNRSGH